MDQRQSAKSVIMALLLSLVFPAAYMVAQFAVSLIFAVPLAVTGNELSGNMLLLVMLISGAVTVAAAVITIKAQRQSVRMELRLRNPGVSVIIMALALGIALNIAGSMIMSLLPIPQWMIDSYNENVSDVLLYGSSPWLMVLTVGVLIPIAEEVALRAMPLRSLRRAIPAAASAVIGGVLFALIHGNLFQILYVLPVGIIFCFVYVWTESIYASAALHIGYNGFSTVLSVIASDMTETSEIIEAEDPSAGAVVAIALITTAISVVLLWAIRRRRLFAPTVRNFSPDISSNNTQ